MTLLEAERLLLSLEMFGMRFGLDRIRRLLTALGSPQERLRVIEVVGTNGKSSTVRMAAAILRGHGLKTGAYLSPHLASFTERVRIDDEDVDGRTFAAAVERAASAADKVDRGKAEDRVTQFELLTAAAIDCFARGGVEVCVVEAGLGGRYDATNALDSEVQLLTNVGLEHTRWLGPTIGDIAAEKLDVVRAGSTLVVGHALAPEARAVAETVCRERGATLIEAPADPGTGVVLGAQGKFQRLNFSLAMAGAEALIGHLNSDAVCRAAATTLVPGRMHVIGDDPLTVVDGAHNPAGTAAVVEALTEFSAGRRVALCIGIRDDKDAAEMLRPLLAVSDAVVATRAGGERALPPATLVSLAGQLGFDGPVEAIGDPRVALARAQTLAGPGGVTLATGSIYLVADLLAPDRAVRSAL
jgi:dihydrofolate synthase/folylpolyglutamate synthase